MTAIPGVQATGESVASLAPGARRERVRGLISEAHRIADEAIAEHLGGKTLAATCVLYSGGNDSTVLAHIFRARADHAIHANTTIGIEETRRFVRDTCAAWGLPLIEEVAPVSYRELVIEQGFPGPAMHFKMYQRLKERCLRAARNRIISNPRRERVLFLAGRRRDESRRRAGIPLGERVGSTIWASPLASWTKLDLNTYRAMMAEQGDPVPENPVSGLLHMSGECLCGSFAHQGELDEIAEWFPDVARGIRELEREVEEAGQPAERCRWGWGAYRTREGREDYQSGPLCSSCDARFDGSQGYNGNGSEEEQ